MIIDGSRLKPLIQQPILALIIMSLGLTHFAFPAARDIARSKPASLDGAAPIAASVTLRTGGKLSYAYHFDHNALRDCVIVRDSLIALTWSGNLLKFDHADLRLTAQAARTIRATSIAVDSEGHALAGFENGEILAVDPVTLKMRPYTAMTGMILWIGASSHGTSPLVVAVADEREKPLDWPGMTIEEYDRLFRSMKRYAKGKLSAGVLPAGPTHRFSPFNIRNNLDDMAPSAFLLDGVGRLWLGVDAGELGGRCAFMDMQTGRQTRVTDQCPGILGFTACSDGRVLAYGGTRHWDLESGVVARVDRGTWEILREFQVETASASSTSHQDKTGERPNADAKPMEPTGLIDTLTETTGKRKYVALSDHVLFETDPSFEHWAALSSLPARQIAEKLRSIGSASAVTTLIRLPGDSESMLIPTGRDGLFSVTGRSIQHTPMSGQLALPPRQAVVDIWPTPLGTMLLADRRGLNANDEFLWRLVGDLWEGLSLKPLRTSQGSNSELYWRETRPVSADGEGVLAHVRDSLITRGKRIWVRLTNDGIKRFTDWDSVDPNDVFQTPDGSTFRAHRGAVLRWRDGDWNVVGSDRRAERRVFRLPGAHGRKKIAFGDQTLPWILFDTEYGRFYRIRDVGNGNLRLENLRFIGASSNPGPILDAAYDGAGMVNLVTTGGAYRLNILTGQLHAIQSPEPPSRVRSLCRDGAGRLWLVGDRLHLSLTNGLSWASFDDLPMVGPTETKRLRPNPDDPLGVILALHDRGVVFLTTR
jgi:hypothetical protein